MPLVIICLAVVGRVYLLAKASTHDLDSEIFAGLTLAQETAFFYEKYRIIQNFTKKVLFSAHRFFLKSTLRNSSKTSGIAENNARNPSCKFQVLYSFLRLLRVQQL